MLVLLAVLVVAGGAVVYLRSRNDDAASAAELAERQRTCASLVNLSSLLGDPARFPAPPGTVRPDAVANVVTTMGGDLDGLPSRAPSKVRNDVRTLVAALGAEPGSQGVASPRFGAARHHLTTFLNDRRNGCQSGSESGDG